jgi:arylsulfatase A-like enzyme
MKSLLISGLAFIGAPCLGQYPYPPIRDNPELVRQKNEYLNSLSIGTGEGSHPNIVIILADDLGKNDISVYHDQGVATHKLDQLAKKGIRLTRATSTCPVSSPSRASLVTGRYQQRFGYERQPMQRYARGPLEFFFFKQLVDTRPMYLREPWYSPPPEEIRKQGLPESEASVFEIFKHSGYATACVGKWHLGYNEPFRPQDKGIDEFYGFYEAFTLYAPTNQKEIINVRHDSFDNRHIWRQKRKGSCAIRRNDQVIEEEGYLTTRIAWEACRFIREKKDKPFFLYVPFSAPHTPFQAPASYVHRFDDLNDLNRQVYYAMITLLDEAIGQIIGELEKLGIAGKTLIIFSSDNGGDTTTDATDNRELNGGKFTQFEGGINVPMIVRWDGHLPAGQDYGQPVSLMDIFSTCLAAAEINPPGYLPVDGINLLPFLRDENHNQPHQALFWRTDFNKAVRRGPWKLLINTRDDQTELYNLDTDKGEQTNLAERYPRIVNDLLRAISDWEKELQPSSWPGIMEIEFNINGHPTRWAI